MTCDKAILAEYDRADALFYGREFLPLFSIPRRKETPGSGTPTDRYEPVQTVCDVEENIVIVLCFVAPALIILPSHSVPRRYPAPTVTHRDKKVSRFRESGRAEQEENEESA